MKKGRRKESAKFSFLSFFKRFYLFILEMGREGERERNIDVWETHGSVASPLPPTRYLAHNPGMCHDTESNWHGPTLNPLSHTT